MPENRSAPLRNTLNKEMHKFELDLPHSLLEMCATIGQRCSAEITGNTPEGQNSQLTVMRRSDNTVNLVFEGGFGIFCEGDNFVWKLNLSTIVSTDLKPDISPGSTPMGGFNDEVKKEELSDDGLPPTADISLSGDWVEDVASVTSQASTVKPSSAVSTADSTDDMDTAEKPPTVINVVSLHGSQPEEFILEEIDMSGKVIDSAPTHPIMSNNTVISQQCILCSNGQRLRGALLRAHVRKAHSMSWSDYTNMLKKRKIKLTGKSTSIRSVPGTDSKDSADLVHASTEAIAGGNVDVYYTNKNSTGGSNVTLYNGSSRCITGSSVAASSSTDSLSHEVDQGGEPMEDNLENDSHAEQIPGNNFKRSRRKSRRLTENMLTDFNSTDLDFLYRESQKNTTEVTEDELLADLNFPMSTHEDVQDVERQLQSKEKMKLLVKRLSAVGGSSAKEVAKRMMSLMFTNILARQYNWVGKGNKQALKPLRITAAIKEAARCNNVTDSKIEFAMKLWVKYAHDRDGGRRTRQLKKEAQRKLMSKSYDDLETTIDSSSLHHCNTPMVDPHSQIYFPNSLGKMGDADIEMPSDPEERSRAIFTNLLQIRAIVESSATAIARLAEKDEIKLPHEEYIGEIQFPMKTLNDVRDVERQLKRKEQMELLVNRLAGVGGSSAKEVASRVMSLMFTTGLALQFNYTGKGNKHALKPLRMAAAIREAARFNNVTDAEIDLAVKAWLKCACNRDGGRKKREQKKERGW